MTRRIAFGLVFMFGTIASVKGWINNIGWIAIVGHLVQIIGIIGVMLVPDEVEVDDTDERRMMD